jgi:Rho GDP-dissociation inhibitor
MRIGFRVHNDIVYGLKYCNLVKRLGMVVEKHEEVIGSYAPSAKIISFDLMPEETPSGMLARGDYKGKSMFIDNDGIVHLQFDYKFSIKKTWD